VLVGLGRKHDELEASFRYLVVGSVGSMLILLAIALTYAVTGSLNMAQVARTFGPDLTPVRLVAMALFLVGFGLKAGLFPFHGWLPDASPSATAPVSAMLSSVVVKTLGVFALARVLFNALGVTPLVSSILLVLGTLSIMIGALMALRQDDMKRQLAYHTVSEIGYMVFALGLGTRPAIAAALFLIMNHAVYKTLLYFNAGSIEYATGTRDLSKLSGLKRSMPVTVSTSVIGWLSLSGVPPFSGFWSRFFIIVAAVQAERYGYAAWAVAGGILTLASFARFQKRILHGEPGEACKSAREVPALMQGVMVSLAVLCVVMGLLWLPKFQNGFFMSAGKIIQEGVQYGTNILGK
jgi:multicomponent Na+:H+ antiporter subunit D